MFAYFPFSIKTMPQALIHYSTVYFQIQNVITFTVCYICHWLSFMQIKGTPFTQICATSHCR